MCKQQNIYCSPLCTEVPPDEEVFAANNSTIWPLELKEYQVQILAPTIVAPEVSMITLIPTFSDIKHKQGYGFNSVIQDFGLSPQHIKAKKSYAIEVIFEHYIKK